MTENKDHWEKDDQIYVVDGQKFGIAPTGLTVGVGLVAGGLHKAPNQRIGALNPQLKGNPLPPPKKAEVLLHKNQGGRPRKPQGQPVSRMTKWRREKETQGVLL